MAKEKKRGFLSRLGFNHQNDDIGGKLEAEHETVNAVEKLLSHAEVETPGAKLISTPHVKAHVPVPDASTRDADAERVSDEINFLTQQIAMRPSHAVVGDKMPMTFASSEAPDKSAVFISPSESKNDVGASLFVVADAVPPKNCQDSSAPSILAADITPDDDSERRSAEDGMPLAPEGQRFFARLKNSLVKTRKNLGSGFIRLFRSKKIDDDLFEELEEKLLVADVGVKTTRKIIEGLTAHAQRYHLKDAEALYSQLRVDMAAILINVEQSLEVTGKTPFVILIVGINGVGKTTTIGKLARQYQAEGKSVMLAAGDTFRAAAAEQLQVWGQRNCIPVVAQQTGADSASVIFDAIQAAKVRGIDVLIADTAGRLQNKVYLMNELKKIVRVMKNLDFKAPHEVMLILDASTGQNAISQVNVFNDAVGLTGITLTKLDGTAKGGVIFAVADRFGIPIRYIGIGEGIQDLRPFKAAEFIEALFAQED
ncbi:MAG: signal recognition particle-docking protein FtsY [Sodalis sp. (in: enterobacteria)]